VAISRFYYGIPRGETELQGSKPRTP